MSRMSLRLLIVLLFPFVAFGQFKNILLAEQKDGEYPPVEPSITINKKNPQTIVAGIVLNKVVVSHDQGKTWTTSTLKSSFGVYGDPALVSNSKGDMFYVHLADPSGEGQKNEGWLDRIVCQQSEDEGDSWSDGISIGHNPPTDQDKAWPAVHPRKAFMCVTWTQFDKYGSTDPNCQSQIMFSKSANGSKWSKPVAISEIPGDCLDQDNTAEGATPVIGDDGKIYVVWANKGNIYLDRSYDDGNTWLNNDLVIAKQEGGWDIKIPGLDRSNGFPQFNLDNSQGRYKGTMYLVWADQRNGADNTDIWLMRSRNRGDFWSKPVRLNQDTTKTHQFLPWMAIDQTNGNVYIVYYDRRDHEDNRTDVYLAYSTDGGSHFKEVKISETPFLPDEKHFFGDYINIDAHAGIVTPIWTRMDGGRTSVWMAVIKEEELTRMK